ncbi:unnamed protein product [Hyaloperonospora brassicae]|uniref:RxLR effector candidate protein n=1 Tax=Hyaloperonospora brassicae TaxID=162125 RepID=A0AAV0TT26_HYABA|nr:unnamed protein product [Hyaloperonospora brassicae]
MTLWSRGSVKLSPIYGFLQRLCQINGQKPSGQRENIDNERDAVSGNDFFSSRVADMTTFLEDMGGFVSDRMQHSGQASMKYLANNVSKGLLNLIAGLDEVVAEQNSLKGLSLDVLPPVLPHELVKLNGRDFTAIVCVQRECLAAR